VLSMKADRRAVVMAQLREVYDGRFDKAFGTGKEVNWTGRVGLVAGVTEAIDKEHAAMAQLGPRFILFRMRQADRSAVAMRALQNSQDDAPGVVNHLAGKVATVAMLGRVHGRDIAETMAGAE
jgi:hypothetical protein